MSVIYKTSKTHYYQIELTPNASRKTFLVKIPSMSWSKFENCKTVKLTDEQFDQFSNFSGDEWMNILLNTESRKQFLVFTEKVKRKKRKMSIVDYYNTYLAK